MEDRLTKASKIEKNVFCINAIDLLTSEECTRYDRIFDDLMGKEPCFELEDLRVAYISSQFHNEGGFFLVYVGLI